MSPAQIDTKKSPPLFSDSEIFTYRNQVMDYFTVDGVNLRTGYTNKLDWYLLPIRELLDNACDFLQKHYRGTRDTNISVIIHMTDKLFHLTIRNSNKDDKPVFSNLEPIFNFDMRYGSKQDVHVISRGMLGDALKQILSLGYVLQHSNGDGRDFTDKQWNYPLIIRHNKKEISVNLEVDNARQVAIATIKSNSSIQLAHTDTELEQVNFKTLLVKYVENYSYLTQIMDYSITNLEKLFIFGRRLLTTLPDQNRTIPQTLKDDIAVKYIELKKTFEGKIELTDREVELESIISTRLTKSADIVASLSELILQINQEYSGRPMTESETLCVDKLVNSILYDDEIISHFKEHGNTLDNILLFSSFKDEFNEKLAKVLRYNEELYVNIKNNETWRTSILETVAKTIKENISKTNKLELSVISNDIDENKESYRRALDSCHDYVWFEDRFLNTDSLSLFENVIKNPKVKSIRILTSLVRNKKINDEFLNEILEYKKILDQKEVTFEVKIVSTKRLHKKMHNRYVLGSNILWDLPPVGLVLDGDSSSIFNDFNNSTKSYEKISKDYGEWWNDPEALEITANWHIIKSLVELYSENLYEDREMHEAKCTICGKVIKVPFIPRPNMPVYCHEHRKLKRSR